MTLDEFKRLKVGDIIIDSVFCTTYGEVKEGEWSYSSPLSTYSGKGLYIKWNDNDGDIIRIGIERHIPEEIENFKLVSDAEKVRYC